MTNALKSSGDWTEARIAIFRLALSRGIGPCRFSQLLQKYGNPEEALKGLGAMGRKDVHIATKGDVEKAVAKADAIGAQILLTGDAAYPFRLAATARPPIILYTLGDQTILDKPVIGIVGARNASTAAKRFIESLARDLSRAGLAVVSGLARGIDAAAHKGSLEGAPIGVVAGGIDIVYPRENRDLQAEIAAQGLLLAESPIGARPTDRHFPRRNRIVAGLAIGVVVIEAAEKSGSLITARFAMEENRDVMAVPGFPGDPRSRGANRLIQDGAALVQSADDILQVIGTPQPERPAADRTTPVATPKKAQSLPPAAPPSNNNEPIDPKDRILSALGAAPVTVDELARECQVSASTIAALLLDLELEGAIERLPGQRVALC